MSRKGKVFLSLGVLGGLLGFFWVGRRRFGSQPMPKLDIWRRVMIANHGLTEAERLAPRVQKQYATLMAGRPRLASRALRWHLEGNLFPGLALYQVLLEEVGDRDRALVEIDPYFRASAQHRLRVIGVLKAIPEPFGFFRKVFLWVTRLGFPVEGWEIEWVANSDRCIGFDIHRCFYLETLRSYGAPELTASFCKGDDVMAESFPPSIVFERTQTLGRGGECCDFRYVHV